MRTPTAALLLAILVLLCAPAAGHARDRMTFEVASSIATDYWAHRDVTVPCRPQAHIYTYAELEQQIARDESRGENPHRFDMFADRPNCQIDVMPWANITPRSDALEQTNYCFEIAHEIGHLAGLEHPDYVGLTPEQRAFVTNTVMDEWGAPPFGCSHLRQWKVLQGWRKAPRWVRVSPRRVQRLWLTGHSWRARAVRDRLLKAERH